MSDYKYIKFTELTSAVGQTEQTVGIYGLRNNSFDASYGYVQLTYLIGDAVDNQVRIGVVGPDGSTPFTSGGGAGYDVADYVNFANAITDFILDAVQSGKTITEVKAGLNGTIRQDLGVITSITFV
jgi:hypothetical protein